MKLYRESEFEQEKILAFFAIGKLNDKKVVRILIDKVLQEEKEEILEKNVYRLADYGKSGMKALFNFINDDISNNY